MEHFFELWSFVVLLSCAFLIGWGAETAQTFIPKTLALTILAWLQTAPEFAVEAVIAWNQQKDLMIANLTGSLRLLLGLGWPMIFFVHFFSVGFSEKKWKKKITLENEDSLSIIFLILSLLYFLFILFKKSLSIVDSTVLIAIYFVFLYFSFRLPVTEHEEEELPWIGKKIVHLPHNAKILATFSIFLIGGIGLYFSAHPFLLTIQKWSVLLGVSTFVFVQWVAPFLSEFPEKLTAFNWARQSSKAPMAVMNMVNSNLNQWTLLAAMIPIVFNLSLGKIEPLSFQDFHTKELALTIAQSCLGALLLLDLEFSIFEASLIFGLWFAQFLYSDLREEVTILYCFWCVYELIRLSVNFFIWKKSPRIFSAVRHLKIKK